MKIAFDAQPLLDSGKTGVSYHEAGLVNALVAAHPEDTFFLEYFVANTPAWSEKTLEPYTKRNCSLYGRAGYSARFYRMIWPFIPVPYSMFFHNKPEITHFFNFTIPPFVQGKRVVTIHDMAFMAFPETVRGRTKAILKLTIKRTLKRADRIVAVSEFSKKEIIKYFNVPAEKISVIYNAVNSRVYNCGASSKRIAEVKSKYGIEGDYFLYLGTLEPRKNLDRLIEAYARFRKGKEAPPCLVLAGKKGWLYDSIFETVKKLGLEKDVIFTDYVPDDVPPVLMRGALAFCFPSLYEGFGMPPLEAMACGTPVLVSDCSSLPEVVGDCAVLADPLSVESIAGGLERLYSDEGLRKDLSERGLSRAAEFTWENMAADLYEIYKELLNEKA